MFLKGCRYLLSGIHDGHAIYTEDPQRDLDI